MFLYTALTCDVLYNNDYFEINDYFVLLQDYLVRIFQMICKDRAC